MLWVVRDPSGDLILFNSKPKRNDRFYWYIEKYNNEEDNLSLKWMLIDQKLFPNLKYTDEPVEIDLKLNISEINKRMKNNC